MKFVIVIFLFLSSNMLLGQATCEEVKEYVEAEDFGRTYYSYGSDAITKVSFHEIYNSDSYETLYFAIVQFTSSYKEYIYQVASNTKQNYSYDYLNGAGEAFWQHIQPYNSVLGCAPSF